jgi:multiple sugar transport system substrate-binding protein
MKRSFRAPTLCALALVLIVAGPVFGQAKKVELNFLEVMTSPARTEVLQKMISAYEAANPGVKINLISPPYEQADNKLTLMLTAEEPLDIVEVRDMTIKQHVTNGRLENLENYLAGWPGSKTFLSVTNAASRVVDGKPYFVPQFFYIKALFVRTDILAKYGIKVMPKTIDDLYAICKKITDASKNQFGFTLRGKGNAYKTTDILIAANIPNIDPENIYMTKDGKSIYESPQFLEAFKSYVDLYKTAVPKDGINWGFNEQINAFVSGITPFLVQDPDTVPLLDKQLGRDKYSVIPIPAGKSGKTYLDYGYAGYGVTSYSKNKQAAWNFIAYMSSAENNAAFCEEYGTLPIHTTTFEKDSFFSTGAYKAWATEMNSPNRFVFVKYPFSSEKFPGWGQVQEQDMQSVLLGLMKPEEATKKWAEYWK